jgi:hypothetical protein
MKRVKLFFILIPVALVSVPAYAVLDTNYYDQRALSNLSLGLSMGNLNTDIPNANNSAISLSSPLTYSLFVAATFNQNLAGEVAYTNLGIVDLGGTTKLKGSAYSLSVVGKFPINESFELIAKAGIANTGAYIEASGSPGGTQTMFAPTFGAGIQTKFNRTIGFRISYDNFKFTTSNSNSYNANIISLSALFRF